ncbi:hypothetical protein B0I35DRAFT_455090 [Stachybotrys elegans]|uniref:Uncharacterized protein n=1 Tax=Stachybotrys elegans TaxID=80388 RepID=A0A8K0SGB7_9HYPO|nr:hypothetical protein B0I35DRAFT_455090 [Stachybotrys elegans]
MKHSVHNVPWDLLVSSFEWRFSNPCKQNAEDFHWSREPTRGEQLTSFAKAFAEAVEDGAACERMNFPENYDKPDPDEIVLSDEVCQRIMPTVHQWRSSPSCYHDYDPKSTVICPHKHTEGSEVSCKCALPQRERKAAAFYREKQDNDCFEFHHYNRWPFFNLEVFKILLLHGEMDALLKIHSDPVLLLLKTYPEIYLNPLRHELELWWGAEACQCEGPDLGWEHISGHALKAYLLLNMIQHLPAMGESVDGAQGRYLNARSYQATIRTITQSGGNSEVATYPHRRFFGIANEQFEKNWELRTKRTKNTNHLQHENPALGKTSYQRFLTSQNRVGYVPLASDIDEVRWALQAKSLPREVIDQIMDTAQYGASTRRLRIEHDPLHPENRIELEKYLSYCWKLMVWSQLVADEIGMDLHWEKLVSKALIDIFSCDCDHWRTELSLDPERLHGHVARLSATRASSPSTSA